MGMRNTLNTRKTKTSMNREVDLAENLPFYQLTDREFRSTLGVWNIVNAEDEDLYDILPNPDKFDDSDPDLMLRSPCSEYFTVSEMNKNQGLSMTANNRFSLLVVLIINVC